MEWLIILTIGVSAAALAVFGEMYLKMSAERSPELVEALINRLMLYRVALLAVENLLLYYAFRRGCQFILMSITQLVCYTVVSVGVGVKVFHEQIPYLKGVGIALALLGVFIIAFSDWVSQQAQPIQVAVSPLAP